MRYLIAAMCFPIFGLMGLQAEDMSLGDQILKSNKEIGEARKQLESIRQEKGFGSKEYQDQATKLKELRATRDKALDQLGSNQSLRRKMRKNIANDRKAADREQEAFKAHQEEQSRRVLSKKEKAELNRKREAEKPELKDAQPKIELQNEEPSEARE